MPQEKIKIKPSSIPDHYRQYAQNTLEAALASLPAYQEWRQSDPGAAYPIEHRYQNLPILTKSDIRKHSPWGFTQNPDNLAASLAQGKIELVKTSGTTDEAIINVWYQPWWDASERASWKLNSHTKNLTGEQPEAILASSRSVGICSLKNPVSFPRRRIGRFLFLNEYPTPAYWSLKHIKRIARELEKFQPVVLEANPSYLAKFCRQIQKTKYRLFQPQYIIITYEFLSELHRKIIQQVFSAPIISSYGTTETGYVFMECERGRLHQNTEFCRVDFQPFQSRFGGPGRGRILVTTFHNPWSTLLRFDVGDVVCLAEKECPCGRMHGFTLDTIEGRIKSCTFATNGMLITTHTLDTSLSQLPEIIEYQLEQTTQKSYILRLITSGKNKRSLANAACDILQRIYGKDAQIEIQYPKTIAPSPSGKYELTRRNFSFDTETLIEQEYLNRWKTQSNIQL